MLIPYTELSRPALRGLISQFLLSQIDDGWDGDVDTDTNAQRVIDALKRGDLVISYSEAEETAAIRAADEVAQPQSRTSDEN